MLFYQKLAIGSLPVILISADEENLITDFIDSLDNDRLKVFLQQNPTSAHFLTSVSQYSPHLKRTMLLESDFLLKLLQSQPANLLQKELQSIALCSCDNEKTLRYYLRQKKNRICLALALMEIAAYENNEVICSYLSKLSDNLLQQTLRWLFRRNLQSPNDNANAKSDDIMSDDITKSGLIVLAMGKLGGCELNYSSDIDLIFFFDKQKFFTNIDSDTDPHSFFIKLVKQLVRIFEDSEINGYVFRIDLRLRPDPGATSIVLSTDAAFFYYESRGENWERAAYIKARPVAADIKAAESFLQELYPFIWRKNIDFSALDDIHTIKKQIIAHQSTRSKSTDVSLAGENIKLCRGGIRDIEFFTQAQQLILGAYISSLRKRKTVTNLQNLQTADRISPKCCEQMQQAYWFLRKLEHRLQMVEDLQCHNLPRHHSDLHSLSRFCGFERLSDFFTSIEQHRKNVQKNYDELFEKIPDNPDGKNSDSIFFGTVDGEMNISCYLEQRGFKRSDEGGKIIFSWLGGRYAATRSSRSRLMLKAVLKHIIDAFIETSQPDEALTAFDKFLSALPTGLQLFSLMKANPNIIRLLCATIAVASALSNHLSKFQNSLDRILYVADIPLCLTAAHYHNEVRLFVDSHQKIINSFEDYLNLLRQFANQEKFHIAIDFLTKKHDAVATGRHFAFLAEALCVKMLAICRRQFAEKHGVCENDRVALVLQGGAGRNILNFLSDLDIVMVYEANHDSMSDGAKSLAASTYYTRLCQRFIAAISAPSAQGIIYNVDMRLRPSGSKGPVAASFESFRHYHQNEAWDWEKIALLRAKIIGDVKIVTKLKNSIKEILTKKDNEKTLKNNLIDMRYKISESFPSKGPADVKYDRGGLIDLDFCLAFLQLENANRYPELIEAQTDKSLHVLKKYDIINQQQHDMLLKEWQLLISLQQILKLTGDSLISGVVQKLVSKIIGEKDLDKAIAKIVAGKYRIYSFCRKTIGELHDYNHHE